MWNKVRGKYIDWFNQHQEAIRGITEVWKHDQGITGKAVRALWTVQVLWGDKFVDTEEWARQRGFEEIKSDISWLLTSWIKEYISDTQGTLVFQCTDREGVNIGGFEYALGDVKFLTFKAMSPFSRIRSNLFTNNPTLAKAALREKIWGEFSNRIQIKLDSNDSIHLSSVDAKQGEYVGEHDADSLFQYWQDFASKGHTRSLLFIGPPGTGKTTQAQKVALCKQGRLLQVNGSLFDGDVDAHSFSQLVKFLSPDVILVDDIQGVGKRSYSNLQEVLHTVEYLNQSMDPETLFIATANRLGHIDTALRRPGRFDTAFEFSLPDQEARREILRHYFEKMDIVETGSQYLDDIVSKTDGLSPAYLMELAKLIHARGSADGFADELFDEIESQRALSRVGEYELGDEDKRIQDDGLVVNSPRRRGRIRRNPGVGFIPTQQTPFSPQQRR